MEESPLPHIRLPVASRPHLVRLLLLLLFLATCSLWFSPRALLTANFLPHWYCLAGNTRLLWTTVLGDLFTLTGIVLEVRDTGCGMNKAGMAHIFEPFFTTEPVRKGTELGLSTAYCIVRQSPGFIEVHSEPGIGTCFEIYFPVVPALQTLPLSFESAGNSPLPESSTILLVDDETGLVHAIGEFLRESGFIVLDAFSSQDALDLAKEYPGSIDVLLSDVVMPGLRGPDLHHQILELQPKIKVLFVSGYAEGLPDMKLPPGAAFLQKPFRFSALLEGLRQLQSGD